VNNYPPKSGDRQDSPQSNTETFASEPIDIIPLNSDLALHVFKDSAGYRWEIHFANGDTLTTGVPFLTKSDAINNGKRWFPLAAQRTDAHGGGAE
jgi:hypothetical protein